MMNFDPDIKYYLIHSKTEKYVSPYGMIPDKEGASEFDVAGLRKRFGASAKATKVLEEKIRGSDFHIKEVNPDKSSYFTITSKIDYQNDDILWVNATYHYGKKVVKRRVIYCPMRGIIRKPKDVSGDVTKIHFEVDEITGKAI